jgi:hypothetical protein
VLSLSLSPQKGGKGNDAGLLVAEARAAFDQTRSLGCDPTG